MLNDEMRIAIWTLWREGLGTRAIAQALQVSRNAVQRVIHDRGGVVPPGLP